MSNTSSIETAHWLNVLLTPFFQERMKSRGVDGSGLYAHYQTLLKNGDLIQQWYSPLVDGIEYSLPPFAKYVVYRAHLGELPFLLSCLGHRVVAVESNEHRRAALSDGLQYIATHRNIMPLVEVVSRFPENSSLGNADNNLAILVDCPMMSDAVERKQFIDSLRSYAGLLINVRTFCGVHEDAAGKDGIVEEIKSIGFSRSKTLTGHFIYFERNGADLEEKPIGIRSVSSSSDHGNLKSTLDYYEACEQRSQEWPNLKGKIAELDQIIIDFLKKRLDASGPDESGLFDYYEGKIVRKTVFNAYDKLLAEVIHCSLFDFDTYVEIGPGVGQLLFLLSLLGHKTLGIEGNSRRSSCYFDLRAHLSTKYPNIPELADCLLGTFPGAVEGRSFKGCLALAPGLVFTATDEQEIAVIQALLCFDAAVIDLSRFVRIRRTKETQAQLIELLHSAGFTTILPLKTLTPWNDGEFVLLRAP